MIVLSQARYTPTMGMVRELASAKLGEPDPESLDYVACVHRGLIVGHLVTDLGEQVLGHEVAKHQQQGGARG